MSWPSSNPSGAGEHDGITTRAHTGGHGTEDPVKMAYFAQRQVLTERLMRYYAAAICGLIAVFVIFHWTHWACVKVERARGASGLLLARPFIISTRYGHDFPSHPSLQRGRVLTCFVQDGEELAGTEGSRVQICRTCSGHRGLCCNKRLYRVHQCGLELNGRRSPQIWVVCRTPHVASHRLYCS